MDREKKKKNQIETKKFEVVCARNQGKKSIFTLLEHAC